MTTWPEVTLDEVSGGKGQYGYTTSASSEGVHQFLRTTDITSGSLDWATVPYCGEEPDSPTKYQLRHGDIVISRMGTVGLSQYISTPPRSVFASYLVRFRVDEGIADPRFVAYVLRSRSWWQYVRATSGSGSVQPNLNAKLMGAFKFLLPPIPEQQRIAGVLGAFDTLIETNRNTQRSMEALAHALFAREGFDALPSGDMVSLGEVIEVNPRVSKPKGQAPYVDMAALPTDSALLGPASAREAAGGAKFHNGDTLLARITPCLENGKTAFVTNLPDQSTGVGSTEFIVLRGSRDTGSFWPYCLARSPRFRAFAIQQLGDGTSGRQRVSAGAVSEYVIPVPGQEPLRRFREAVEPLVEGMIALHEEALDLTRQRDELLPLLMSGKVRVSDLEGVA